MPLQWLRIPWILRSWFMKHGLLSEDSTPPFQSPINWRIESVSSTCLASSKKLQKMSSSEHISLQAVLLLALTLAHTGLDSRVAAPLFFCAGTLFGLLNLLPIPRLDLTRAGMTQGWVRKGTHVVGHPLRLYDIKRKQVAQMPAAWFRIYGSILTVAQLGALVRPAAAGKAYFL